tara:strand:+ start:3881 stop:5350 length:1470 start_codon:yes stop_codon:yes gene_type:complete
MAKDARSYQNKETRNAYKFDFPGAGEITFPSQRAYDRAMYLMDLFTKPGPDGKIQKTTMDPAVLASSDNPLAKGSPSKAGGLNIELKAIPTKEFEKKYKLTKAGIVREVPKMNPHVSQIKPKYTNTKKEVYPTTKPWVGAPFTMDELQPNNRRYVQGMQALEPCTTCQGFIGMNLKVMNCLDGSGPFWYPCATVDNAIPTANLVGQLVSRLDPSDPNYTCANQNSTSTFEIVEVTPCGTFNGAEYPTCSQLITMPNCPGLPGPGTGCAVAFSASQNPLAVNGRIDVGDPNSLNGITDNNFDLDLTRYPTQPPYNGNCMATTTQFNSVIPPVAVWPYSVMVPVSIAQAHYQILDQLSQNFPNTSVRTKRGNVPASSCTNCTAVCDNTYQGITYKVGVIMYFYPMQIGVDPITGSGVNAVPSSISAYPNGGWYYDTWTEMMDDLIAAGEYTGSNTDSLTDIWNAGIRLAYGATGCIDCSFQGPSCAPAQSI